MILSPQHLLLKLSVQIAELCQPLSLLHISHFTYMKKFHNGGRIILSSKPNWVYDYCDLHLYESSLFETKPSIYQTAFNVWTGDYDLAVYRHGRQYYNTADSISITEATVDGCEHFLFSTTPDKAQAIQYLVSHREILYHFILYLRDRGATILKKAQSGKIIVPKEIEQSLQKKEYFATEDFYQEMRQAKKNFLKATRVRRYHLKNENGQNSKLSEREITCLKYLLQHKTAAETGTSMNISRRTVESYLENIKVKLNCDSKLALLKKIEKDRFLESF